MKKLSLLFMAILLSVLGMAQDSNFEQEMLKRIQQIRQTENKVNLLNLSKEFESLGNRNPSRYEAKYYQALCLVFYSFEEKDKTQKDIQLDKAELIIDKILKTNKKDDELYILKALCYQMKIDIDPVKRGYEFSQKAAKELQKAFRLNEKNPRYYFLQGQNIYYTPVKYGGGKEKAKPYFEKAQKLFKTQKPNTVLSATWGEGTNAMQLKICNKK